MLKSLDETLNASHAAVQELLERHDCDEGTNVHGHRLEALKILHGMLDQQIEALSTQQHSLSAGAIDEGGVGDNGDVPASLVSSLLMYGVGLTMVNIAEVSIACQETSLAYKWLLASFRLQKLIRRRLGDPLVVLPHIDATVASLRGGGSGVAGAAVCVAATPPTESDLDFTLPEDKTVCVGVSIFARTVITIAQLWSRWGEPVLALRLLTDVTLRDTSRRRHELAKAALVAEHAARLERTESLRAMDQQAQMDQLQLKLMAKRNKRQSLNPTSEMVADIGADDPPTGATATFSSGSKRKTTTAKCVQSALHAFRWMRNFSLDLSPSVGGVSNEVVGEDDVMGWLWQGMLEDEDRHVRPARVMCLNCAAQVWKCSLSTNPMCLANSAFYCHQALAEQLLCPAGSFSTAEWVDACLALCDWYLLVRDLSHLESCVAAAHKFIRSSTALASSSSAGEGISNMIFLKYYEASFAGSVLQLFYKSNTNRSSSDDRGEDGEGDVCVEQLFNNELLPPVDCQSGSVGVDSRNRAAVGGGAATQSDHESPAPWVRPERVPFLALDLPPPRQFIQVPRITSPGAVAEALKYYRQFQSARSDAGSLGMTIDSHCEEYLELLRLAADAEACMFTYDPDESKGPWMMQRLELLQQLLRAQLNANAFRNVLRQAQYDAGGTCMVLGKRAAARQAGRVYFEQAKAYYADFVSAFDAERSQAQAIKKETSDVFDESDYPSYVLGLMQLALAEMALGRTCAATSDGTAEGVAACHERAVTCLSRCRRFIELNRKLLEASYPATLAYDEQCAELMTMLGQFSGSSERKVASSESLNAETRPEAQRHVDVARAAAPKPLLAGTRILAKGAVKKT